MNSETIALIDKLATKLGTTTEYLWGVLIAQRKAYLIGTGIQYLICFATMWFGTKYIRKALKDNDNITPWQVLSVCATVIAVFIAAMASFFEIEEYVSAIINPEGYALQYILQLMNKGVK
jgi:hypothetical protein